MNDEMSTRKINMYRNDDLFHRGKLSREEVAQICNPYNLKDFTIPADFKNFPIGDSRIQTLLGEQVKRLFDWRCFVTNRDAISKIEEDKKNMFMQMVQQEILAENTDKNIIESKIAKLQEYLAYDYQDIREKTANELLHHYSLYLDTKTIFNRAWKDLLLFGECVINIDFINGKPFAERVDSRELYWSHSTAYPYIDDQDAVIREHYVPLGHIVDYYYEFLSEEDLETLEEKRLQLTNRQWTIGQQWTKDQTTGTIIPNKDFLYVDTDLPFHKTFQGYYDAQGNIRVVHARWMSLKQVGKVTYIDESGTEQETWVDETYVKQPEDVIEWCWINEPWECTQIGTDIFIKAQPRDVQYRKLDNKSAASLGYVGTFIEKAVYDVIKEYQIKYSAYMYRTEQAMIKALGKVGVLDLAMIPDGWDMDTWMYYTTVMGWAVTDSFKEGKKGAATGKLSGTMGINQSNVINLEQSAIVSQNMEMMRHLEDEMDIVIGTSPQRRGQISQDAGLGVTQEARQASSTITESYFTIMDNVKMRVLEKILEVAKFGLKNKTESIQYITSDLTSRIFEVDGDMINEAEYGLKIGNATEDAAAINNIKQALGIALQSGECDLIELMIVNSNESAADKHRKLEKSVMEKRKAAAEQHKAEQDQVNADRQSRLQELQLQHADNDKDRDLKYYEVNANNETKLAVAEMTSLGLVKDAPVDIIDQAGILLDERKHVEDVNAKRLELQHKDKTLQAQQGLEKAKLDQKDRADKVKERIAKLKAETEIRKAQLTKASKPKK